MKKIIVLITSLLLLTGCVKVSFTSSNKESKTSQTTISKKEDLTFVRDDNEILELAEKFIKDNPTLGDAGKLFVFFPGYTFGDEETRLALFLMVNRTTTTIDRDASFVVNLEYDRAPILENITVDYQISESGVLKPNMVSAIPLKITKEQEEKLNSMTDSSKAKMSFKDFKYKSKG